MSDVKRNIAIWFVAFNCKIGLLCCLWSFLRDTVEGPRSRSCSSGAGGGWLGPGGAVLCLSPGAPGLAVCCCLHGLSCVWESLGRAETRFSLEQSCRRPWVPTVSVPGAQRCCIRQGWAAVGGPTRDEEPSRGSHVARQPSGQLCFPLSSSDCGTDFVFFFLNVDHF